MMRTWLGLLPLVVACAGPPEEPLAVTRLSVDAVVDIVEPASALAVLAETPEPSVAVDSPQPPQTAPAPPLFDGQSTVSVEQIVGALAEQVESVSMSEDVKDDYVAFSRTHNLPLSDERYLDYVRVKIAFESTRDAGWWHVSWRITNRDPNSTYIWNQWKKPTAPPEGSFLATATAECDKLSALFAFVARRMGVDNIGLYWPVWNHVVAVWTVENDDGDPVRVVVPTSQIFLSDDASLGTTEFDPWTQKTIFEYRKADVKMRFSIPADLARYFVEQVDRHARKSQVVLQRERNVRDAHIMATARAGIDG